MGNIEALTDGLVCVVKGKSDTLLTVMCPLRLPFILKQFVPLLDWLRQSVLLLGSMRHNEDVFFTFVVFQNGKVTYPIPNEFRTEIKAKIPFLWVILQLRQRPIVHFCAICSRSPVICLF